MSASKWQEVAVGECPVRGRIVTTHYAMRNYREVRFCEECGTDHVFSLMVARFIDNAVWWKPTTWFSGEWQLKDELEAGGSR